jgi:opacity protein-like surface antigen
MLLVLVLAACLVVAPLSAAQALSVSQDVNAGAAGVLAYPYANGGSAVVDGNPAEWNLAADYFAAMYRAGNTNFTVLSQLYLRYNCTTNTLYLLVLAEPGSKIESFHTQAENWAKIGTQTLVSNLSGNNGVPPDFSYINSNGTHADGWEASFVLNPGSYSDFNVHTQVNDGSAGGQTSAVANRSIQLTLDCTRLGSIGDYVWHDADGEGDQDEPPANGLAGVRIRLLNSDATQVLDVQTTDSDGFICSTTCPQAATSWTSTSRT